MEYIENNIAVLVTVYGINQERRYYKKRCNEHTNYMSLVVRKPVSLRKHVHLISAIFHGYKNGNFGSKIVIYSLFFCSKH